MIDRHYWNIKDNTWGLAWKRGKQARYSCRISSLERGPIAHKYNAFRTVDAAKKWAVEKLGDVVATPP